ncbi:unnamed protein product [Arctia plantaginis]|uniref:Uncharacterized protein n=1 Tax=Arctia plantaginis TaxID=874455 RepID=A0A8S0ZAH8_ARCPL|nr:unnamed protein product [Arctia plantaginis]
MLKRRLFEEWKRGVGIGDQAVSPELMGNDRAFWDTIVYGAGEESDATGKGRARRIGCCRASGFSGRGAHIIARCPHCAWGRRKCRRRAGPAYHEAGGSCGGSGEKCGSRGGAGQPVNLEPIKDMTPDWEWSPALYRVKHGKLVSSLEPCCKEKGPLVSLLLPERVCPICVIQHLAGDRENIKLIEGQKPYLDAGALSSLILTAHNQEMHALNGNINFSVIHDTARADVMAAALTRPTRGVRHRHAIQVETERRLRVAQEEVPMLVYTSNVANGVGLVSAPPTRHQLFWFYGSLAQPESAGEASNQASGCGEPSIRSPAPSILKTTGTTVPPPPSASSVWGDTYVTGMAGNRTRRNARQPLA